MELALRDLQDVPYGFSSGLWGEKAAQPPLSSVQCAYLPWYAWFAQGFDLDSDGGRLVTVADLAASPLLEVVQAWGMDPARFSGRWAEEQPPATPAAVLAIIFSPAPWRSCPSYAQW